MNILYHIDDKNKWDLVLKNIEEMVDYYEEHQIDYDIEVVAVDEAILGYQKKVNSNLYKKIENLFARQVSFLACHSALKELDIQMNDIFDFVYVVPNGMVEIAQKQAIGFSYIKI